MCQFGNPGSCSPFLAGSREPCLQKGVPRPSSNLQGCHRYQGNHHRRLSNDGELHLSSWGCQGHRLPSASLSNVEPGRKVLIHKSLHPHQSRTLRYQYPEFREDVTEALKKLTISPNNLMFTATTAKNYVVFEEVSKMLMEKCGDFLRTRMSTPDDVFNFLLASHSNFPDGKTELLIELLRANGKCSNCKTCPCLLGQDVLVSHSSLFWNGMVVAKKQPISDGTCGFPCNQPPSQQVDTAGLVHDGLGGSELVHAGLAVVRSWSSEPRHQRLGFADQIMTTLLQLQCITHRTSLSDQQASASRHLGINHFSSRVNNFVVPQPSSSTARRPIESSLLNAHTGLAEFVFACGVASQLSWQRIMG